MSKVYLIGHLDAISLTLYRFASTSANFKLSFDILSMVQKNVLYINLSVNILSVICSRFIEIVLVVLEIWSGFYHHIFFTLQLNFMFIFWFLYGTTFFFEPLFVPGTNYFTCIFIKPSSSVLTVRRYLSHQIARLWGFCKASSFQHASICRSLVSPWVPSLLQYREFYVHKLCLLHSQFYNHLFLLYAWH